MNWEIFLSKFIPLKLYEIPGEKPARPLNYVCKN